MGDDWLDGISRRVVVHYNRSIKIIINLQTSMSVSLIISLDVEVILVDLQ